MNIKIQKECANRVGGQSITVDKLTVVNSSFRATQNQSSNANERPTTT